MPAAIAPTIFALAGITAFIAKGRGTPAPFDAPRTSLFSSPPVGMAVYSLVWNHAGLI